MCWEKYWHANLIFYIFLLFFTSPVLPWKPGTCECPPLLLSVLCLFSPYALLHLPHLTLSAQIPGWCFQAGTQKQKLRKKIYIYLAIWFNMQGKRCFQVDDSFLIWSEIWFQMSKWKDHEKLSLSWNSSGGATFSFFLSFFFLILSFLLKISKNFWSAFEFQKIQYGLASTISAHVFIGSRA